MNKGFSAAWTGTRAVCVFCARAVSAVVALCGVALGVGAAWFIVDRVGLDTLMGNPVTAVLVALFTIAYFAAILTVLGIAIAGSVRAMSVDLRRGSRLLRRRVRRAVSPPAAIASASSGASDAEHPPVSAH